MGAGCVAVGEFIGDVLLKEGNVFNETDQRVSGSVEIVGPGGETVLNGSFDLVPAEGSDAGDAEKNTAVTDDDVWTGAGAYEVSVELGNTAIEGTTGTSETGSVADPGAEMLGVTLGPEAGDEAILVRVSDDLAGISDPADVSTEGN